MNKIKRIVLKISGEALEDKTNHEAYSEAVLNNLVKVIQKVHSQNVQIGIVVGGGNIYRGKESYKIGLDNTYGDYMGMIATIMNGLALKGLFAKNGLEAEILSSLQVSKCTKEFTLERVNKYFNNKKIVIFTGGIGHPCFTTDTCAALRAREIKADCLLMAKNGVDGVYSADPKVDKNAKFISKLTYSEILNSKLEVIDSTAASLLNETNIVTYIFNIDDPKNILKIISGEKVGTVVTK